MKLEPDLYYRINPAPKREQGTIYDKRGVLVGTIDLVDGKPDLSIIHMEETR